MDVPSENRTARTWTETATIIVVWLVLSLIIAVQRYADAVQSSLNVSFFYVLFWSIVLWSYWALATPVIFRLERRFPLNKPNRIYAALFHSVIGLLFSLVHIALFAALGVVFSTAGSVRFVSEFSRVLRFFLYVELVFYWAILGAGIARDSYQKYREREIIAKELETKLGLAQLQALKMQIQPHFLFNALNTVAMLIRNGENNQAVEMVAGLGNLLRSSLKDDSTQEVALSSELDFIQRYLAIERFRFPDRLKVEIEVPDDLLGAEVPNLILQPLVENAIRHGIAKSSSAGLVRVAAKQQSLWLELSVQDDGPGLSSNWQSNGKQGIGLKNTKERLEKLYPDRSELLIQNLEPNGTKVDIRIPYRRHNVTVQNGKDQNVTRR